MKQHAPTPALLALQRDMLDILEEIQDRFRLYFRSRSVPQHIYDAQVQRFEEDLEGVIEVARRDLELWTEEAKPVEEDD